jgi:hypothetical protein
MFTPFRGLRVCVNLKQDHTVQRRSCRRVPGGRAYMTTGLVCVWHVSGREGPETNDEITSSISNQVIKD